MAVDAPVVPLVALLIEHDRAYARRAAAVRGRAAGIVSHDLCNALGTIRICAEALLDEEVPSGSGVRDMARIIQRAGDWMQQMGSTFWFTVTTARAAIRLHSNTRAADAAPSPSPS